MNKLDKNRMDLKKQEESNYFGELCDVIDTLLSEGGCPWDREQTHESLRMELLEESYEAADAIDNNDANALCEELGDLFFLILFHSRIADKSGHFGLSDVIKNVSKKLVTRHNHVFGSIKEQGKTPEEVVKIWDENKNKEKNISTPLSNMEAVPKALPALVRAQKIIKRSENDFLPEEIIPEIQALLDKCTDEKENFGRILFLLTALLTKMQINAEFVLTNETEAFINSFR